MDALWFETAFDVDYLHRYSHRDAAEADRAAALFLRHLPAAEAGAPRVLDLCCGWGRHLRSLAGKGLRVAGGDLSLPLLRHAVRENRAVVRLDMRELPFRAGSFHAVANFFTAFGYFDDDAENFRVLGEVARVLRPGGIFFFDFLNAERVARSLAQSSESIETSSDGTRWMVRRTLSADGLRAEKTHLQMGGGSGTIHESVRLFSRAELEAALARAGLAVQCTYGDFGGAPFSSDSERLIFVCGR